MIEWRYNKTLFLMSAPYPYQKSLSPVRPSSPVAPVTGSSPSPSPSPPSPPSSLSPSPSPPPGIVSRPQSPTLSPTQLASRTRTPSVLHPSTRLSSPRPPISSPSVARSIPRTNLDAKSIGEIVKKDKLEQALKNNDPRLELLREIIDLPKLLELLDLKAGYESGVRPYEDVTASKKDAEEAWETGGHWKSALDETVRNDVQIEDEVISNSETIVEHLVPEIPPSPLGYSIDLVCADKDYDVGDDTGCDPELAESIQHPGKVKAETKQ